ncbi:MAG: NYN domain-containing protein [Archaeoglobaceae archaeon]|nr:NYN domain-containing protein [Archaeoglobaceae archaeon]
MTDSTDPNDRVMIFIDGSNLFHACKNFRNGFKVDYEKLRNVLAAGRKLIRAYYYGSFNSFKKEVADRQKKFFQALQEMGFEVVDKPLRKRNESYVIEKGVDIVLAVDMLSLAFRDAYDIGILVSGDADFVRAIEVVKYLGKRIEVAMFRNNLSSELRRKADKYIILDNIADKIEKK